MGSIPAHAGKPWERAIVRAIPWVYPRPRGEASPRSFGTSCRTGLSPPTRGSLAVDRTGRVTSRSIPAHAGKPWDAFAGGVRVGVYPRPRGEARESAWISVATWGLSPPTRGSPRYLVRAGLRVRSIPAHAGKPSARQQQQPSDVVYPRPRGEATAVRAILARPEGLSPPTRGSLALWIEMAPSGGSIPAHAGKPPASMPRSPHRAVYPRPRGEADSARPGVFPPRGLSPPTRGSLGNFTTGRSKVGSIPAHAGKPIAGDADPRMLRVYPRPRGEAARRVRRKRSRWGLSPPTRGSRRLHRFVQVLAGSIPAHAGKPSCLFLRETEKRVYPRPRGEADRGSPGPPDHRGLSPPTRGSRIADGEVRGAVGSIPAHAGKPGLDIRTVDEAAVYPRPRGEAGLQGIQPLAHPGLSPPTRGSLAAAAH